MSFGLSETPHSVAIFFTGRRALLNGESGLDVREDPLTGLIEM